MDLAHPYRIKAWRRKLGLTQSDLAERLAVTATTVSRWERGQACPRPRYLAQLAGVLEIPRDTLRKSLARHVGSPARVRVAAQHIARALDTIAAEHGFEPRPRRPGPGSHHTSPTGKVEVSVAR